MAPNDRPDRLYPKESGLSGDLSLGLLARDDLPGDLGEVAFAVGKGEATDPVKTDFGWHIVQVDDIQAGSTRTFEEVRDELRGEIALRLAGDILYDSANELEDALAGGISFADDAWAIAIDASSLADLTNSGKLSLPLPRTTWPSRNTANRGTRTRW